MNPRTCIVTRDEKDPDSMIRFVLDGQRSVVPDIHRKLPGRGVWVTGQRSMVREACKKRLFDRGFGAKVTADAGLPDLVAEMLERAATGLLALARKAGVLISGRAKVEELVHSGTAAFVLHATDAKGDGHQKIQNAIRNFAPETAVFERFERDFLDGISGVANTAHVAVADSGIASKAKHALEKIEQYEAG